MTADQARMEAGPVVDLSGRWLFAVLLLVLAVWLVVAATRSTVRKTRDARDRRWARSHRIEARVRLERRRALVRDAIARARELLREAETSGE